MGKFSVIVAATTATLSIVLPRVLTVAEHPSKEQQPNLSLSDGNFMPQVGVGTYRAAPGQECYQSVRWALEVGYRLVDTAQLYGNEEDVGQAILDSGIPREDIFITTKVHTRSHGYEDAIEVTEDSLEELQTSYIDLLLIHNPYGERLVETWDAMVALQKQGKVRSIGVSNFGIQHLEALREHGRPTPVVNQIELHPLNYKARKELVDYCKQHDIVITAYGSLFSGFKERYQDEMLQSLATKYKKTVPQILLRWGLDNGFAVIPKSASSKKRLEENFDLFDLALTPQEVESISSMSGPALDAYWPPEWDPIDNAEVDIGDLSHGASEEEL